MGRYAKEFPDADVVLFEPAQDDEVKIPATRSSYADRAKAGRARLSPYALKSPDGGRANSGRSSPGTDWSSTAQLFKAGRGVPTEPSQTGKLWDSVKPLEKTLGASWKRR